MLSLNYLFYLLFAGSFRELFIYQGPCFPNKKSLSYSSLWVKWNNYIRQSPIYKYLTCLCLQMHTLFYLAQNITWLTYCISCTDLTVIYLLSSFLWLHPFQMDGVLMLKDKVFHHLTQSYCCESLICTWTNRNKPQVTEWREGMQLVTRQL